MLSASFKPRILCVSIYEEMAQLVRHSAGQFGVEVDVFDGGIYNNGHNRVEKTQGTARAAAGINPCPRLFCPPTDK